MEYMILDTGRVVATYLHVEDGRVKNAIAYNLHPHPNFTSVDGGKNVTYAFMDEKDLEAIGAVPYDAQAFDEHIRKQRRLHNVTWDDVVEMWKESPYAHELEENPEARELYP